MIQWAYQLIGEARCRTEEGQVILHALPGHRSASPQRATGSRTVKQSTNRSESRGEIAADGLGARTPKRRYWVNGFGESQRHCATVWCDSPAIFERSRKNARTLPDACRPQVQGPWTGDSVLQAPERPYGARSFPASRHPMSRLSRSRRSDGVDARSDGVVERPGRASVASLPGAVGGRSVVVAQFAASDIRSSGCRERPDDETAPYLIISSSS
jgi:hypothetical protein